MASRSSGATASRAAPRRLAAAVAVKSRAPRRRVWFQQFTVGELVIVGEKLGFQDFQPVQLGKQQRYGTHGMRYGECGILVFLLVQSRVGTSEVEIVKALEGAVNQRLFRGGKGRERQEDEDELSHR